MCHGAAIARKSRNPVNWLERLPAAPLAGEQQIRNGRAEEEHRRDKALGEQRQRHAGPHPVGAQRLVQLQAGDERVERGQQEEGELRFRNDEARKQEWAHRGEHGQACVEAGAIAPGAARPGPAEPGKRQHGQRVGQMRGEGVLHARDFVDRGHDPVGQRRLLNVADAVDVRRNPVAGIGNVLSGLGVRGVHVVEQRRGPKRSKINRSKKRGKQQPDGARGKRLAWPFNRSKSGEGA